MAVRNHHCRHSSNEIVFGNTLFFLDTFKENFSKSSAYNAVKKYQGNAKAVKLSKKNGKWIFTEIIHNAQTQETQV